MYICSPKYSGSGNVVNTTTVTEPLDGILFDAKLYSAINKDLNAAFGNDEAALKNHFVNNGIKEGRVASVFFDPHYYLANNADVAKAVGSSNFKGAYDHFVSNGFKEGRQGSPYFSAKVYLSLNADIANAYGSTNYLGAAKHYLQNGINEMNRTASREYSQAAYYSRYADLRAQFGTDGRAYIIHYINNGKAEGRNASSVIEKLSISNVKVSNINSKGYTVSCTATSGYGVKEVKFPVWTSKNGQDDIIWYQGTKSGNTYSAKITIDKHNKEGGDYISHIYAYDNNGNVVASSAGTTKIDLKPNLSNVKVTNVTPTGYTISCVATSTAGIKSVKFPTWTSTNGQDDIKWYEGTRSGNTWSYRVDVKNHGVQSGTYNTHVYAYDNDGNSSSKATSTVVDTKIAIRDIKITNVTSKGYTISCVAEAGAGVNRVMFPTWTSANGQDDIIWANGTYSNGVWSHKVEIKNHKNGYGTYNTHIYAYDSNNKSASAARSIVVYKAPVVSDVKITDVTPSGYTVSCKAVTTAGVKLVKFPTWTESGDQDDIKWYEGTRNGDTWSYRVNVKDHNYMGGKYITHVYAYDNDGNSATAGTSVTLNPKLTVSDVKVTNLTANGFSVSCTVTSGKGITSVNFPIWSDANGQDDIVWYKAEKDDNTWYCDVNIKDHKYDTDKYIIHIYATEGDGKMSSVGATTVNVPLTKPTISDIKVTNINNEGYTVSCMVTSPLGVTNVQFPTWTKANSQDDIVWANGTKNGNQWSYTVKLADHKGEDGEYITHIYATDAKGTRSSVATSATVNVRPVISDVKVSGVDPTGYTVSCKVTAVDGVKSVKFPTWSEVNGQDDIIWSEGTKNGDTWSYRVNVKDHKCDSGKYITHIYAYDNSNRLKTAGVSTNVNTNPVISNVKITDVTPTGYTVSCKAVAGSGISSVKFPTWSNVNGQDDIVWHEGTKNGDTWSYRVNVKDHKYDSGTYTTHIYAYDNSSNHTTAGTTAVVDTSPKITDLKVTGVTANGYTVSCKAEAGAGIKSVKFPTWSDVNGQDDIVWHEGTRNGDIWTFTVKVAEHKYDIGKYNTHVYAYDNNDKTTSAGTAVTVNAGYLDLGADFYARIGNPNSGLNLSLSDSNVIIYTPSDKPAQVWHFVRQSNGSYKVINTKNNLVLDVQGAGTASGTNVQICTDNGGSNQRWYIYNAGGKFALKPANSTGCALDVAGASKTAGANIQIYTYNASAAQIFTVNKTSVDTTVTANKMEVIRKIIYAVETGGQVYGRADYTNFTEAYANSSAEHAITIGAGQWYATEAKTLLNKIRSTDPATFAALDTAGIAYDLDTADWSVYKVASGSAKAVCIQNIIGTTVGRQCQDALLDEQMAKYMKQAADLGVTDLDAQMMCANIRHQGGTGALKRVLGKTAQPYTLDNIYAALQTDTGNQVGAYKKRQAMVYNSLKTYL